MEGVDNLCKRAMEDPNIEALLRDTETG